MILSHIKGHWFYFVTQSLDPEVVEFHDEIEAEVKGLVKQSGTEGLGKNTEDHDWHYFSNLPEDLAEEGEDPKSIVKGLEDEIKKA